MKSLFETCVASRAARAYLGTMLFALSCVPFASTATSLNEFLGSLNLDKPAIMFSDPEVATPEAPVTMPVPASFSFGPNGGLLNPKGGSLVVLESTPPGGLPDDLTTLDRQYVSDILLFLPNAPTFYFYSDPFPVDFRVPSFDSNGLSTGDIVLSFGDLLRSDNGRRVTTIQEGSLVDQRRNPPLGAGPIYLPTTYELNDVTIFVNRFNSTDSQAYVIQSDTPEPGSVALLGAGLAVLVALTRRRGRPCAA